MARFGEINAQYFDDAGDPLSSGKIYFYETGTTTLKDTFSDINQTIANTNPVILTAAGRQPNIFFSGTAKAILVDKNDVQILVRDPVGQTASVFGDGWVATKIYSADAVVLGSDGQYYRSLAAGNQNNDPTSTSGYWTLLYSVEWNAGITYQEGAVVTYNGEQYQSLQNTNLNNNPSSATSYWVLLSFAWLSTRTYAINENAVGTDGILYTSLQNSNTGNIPASSPAYWVGTSAAAAASATAAAASATAAAASETAAETAETNAAASETAAAASETAAAASESAAATSETNAASSASAASTSETNAAASETAAASSASAASTSETNAASSASAASTSETNAAASETAAAASETAAAASESAAATSETNAASSASAASTSASNASTSETNAAGSATAAASSATAAAGSATAAAGSATDAADKYDQFDDRYLGDKASDPTLDNDGNALLTGALYFNTTSDDMKVYNGSAWQVTAINPADPTFTGTVTADGLVIDTDTLYVDSVNNRVGIGTTSPSNTLHVSDSVKNTALFERTGSGDQRIQLKDGNTVTEPRFGASGDDIAFETNNAEAMRIDSSGNVGIGISSPNNIGAGVTTLDLGGNDATQADRSGGVTFTRYDGTRGMYIAHVDSQNVFAGLGTYPMLFRTDNTERMRIDSSGNVGIGTSTIPTGVLLGRQLVASSSTGAEIIAFKEDSSVDVGNIAGAFLIGNSDTDGVEDHFVGMWGKVSSTNGSQNLHFAAGRSGYEGDAPQMTLASSGNVGIGTSSPTEKLDVSGTVKATAFEGDGSGLTGVGGGAWTFINSTTVSGTVSSIDITSGINSTYDMYVLQLVKVAPVNTGSGTPFRIRTSTDGGSTFDSSGYSYAAGSVTDAGSGFGFSTDVNDSFIRLANTGSGATSGESLSGFIYLVKPSDAANFYLFWDLAGLSFPTSQFQRHIGGGQRETAADVDAIRIYHDNSIDGGTVRLFGINNS